MITAGIDDRGRFASRPGELTVLAWRDIGWRIWESLARDRVTLVSAGVAFYALLSLVPALAAMVALYGLAFDRAGVDEQMASLASVLPAEARALIEEQLARLVAQPADALGVAFLISLGLSLWSASAGTKALIDGLNIVYGESEKRSFLKFNLVALGITLIALLAAISTLAVTVAVPIVLGYVVPVSNQGLATAATYGVLLVALWTGLICLYRFAPSRQNAQWRWLAPGTFVAVALLVGLSAGFSWFARTFAGYDAYGSIGATLAVMTWTWAMVLVVLLGAEINAEMEHQTGRDTTTGAPKPIGTRGARMADTIGATTDERQSSTSNSTVSPRTQRSIVPEVAAGIVIGVALTLMFARQR